MADSLAQIHFENDGYPHFDQLINITNAYAEFGMSVRVSELVSFILNYIYDKYEPDRMIH